MSDRWLKRSIERLALAGEDASTRPFDLFSSNPLVPLVPILSVMSEGKSPQVLDYGGNLGQLGIWIRQQCKLDDISWTVVERPDFLQEVSKTIPLPESIDFVSSLEDAPSQVDLVHFGSSIQYVDDLEGEFAHYFARARPTWISIADFMGGDSIDTFVTKQKYDQGFLKSKFRKTSELSDFLSALGFDLVYQSGSLNERNLTYYPPAGLPPKSQIDYPLDLIYKRKGH